MPSAQYGTIVDVSTNNIGESITVDAIVGATVITVVDPTTFDEAGGQVLINDETYMYSSIDETASTITLTAGLVTAAAIDDRVEIYPPHTIKQAMVDLGIPEGEAIRVTVPHALGAALGDGIRDETNREVVLLEQRNIGDIHIADVVSTPAKVQASGYVEGATGWLLDDQHTQVANLNAIETVGAAEVSAGAFTIGGLDLETEFLSPLPLGIVANDSRTGTNSDNTSGTTELKLFEYSYGPLMAGRFYRTEVYGHIDGSVADDCYDMGIRYTTDGTVPGIASTILRLERVDTGAVTGVPFRVVGVFSPGTDYDQLRMCLTMKRTSGTGVANLVLNDANRRLIWQIYDMGLVASAQAGGVLSQKSYADATPADPDPVTTYTRTYWSTYARSYDSDGGTRNPDGSELYQGYVSSTHGRTRSLFGFDHALIQSHLAGATIVYIKLTWRVQHAYNNAGMNVYISSHNYTSKPATWSGSNVNEDRLHGGGFKEGNTYTRELPIAVGNEFKAGTTRGLGFGPGPSNDPWAYYGYMYGYGSTSRPRITIQFKK